MMTLPRVLEGRGASTTRLVGPDWIPLRPPSALSVGVRTGLWARGSARKGCAAVCVTEKAHVRGVGDEVQRGDTYC